jgi:hypothetical protein
MSNESLADARAQIGNRGEIQITNHEEYKRFVELSKHPILNAEKYITVSDGRTLSLGYPRLPKAIETLPAKEIEQINIRKKLYHSICGQRNAAYSKAYGTTLNHNGVMKRKAGRISPLFQRSEEIIELFGKMFTVKEIHEICLKDWDLKVTISVLVNFREVNKHVILQKIEGYKKSYDSVRLCHKRSRLEELSWLYTKRKAVHQASGKADDHKLLLQTLEQLRKEAEGDTLRIDGNLNVNMEMTIKNQIENEMMKHMLIKEIIISRVCAKIGADPVRMMTSIKDSYYRKRLESVEDIPHEDVRYPSEQAYDFNKIDAINKQLEQRKEVEKKKYEESRVISNEVVDKSEEIKKKLIAKLKGKQTAVNKIKNSAFFSQIKKNDKNASEDEE